jgi:hypothetical protein
MERRTASRLTWGSVVAAVAAVIAIACSNNSTSPHVGTPCPKYSGGSATPTTLVGDYTLTSFCQDTLPAFGPLQGVTGTLTLTNMAPDSFKAVIMMTGQQPLALAGPYSVSHDTITVTLPAPLGTFIGTYAFAATAGHDTLSVSGHLPGNPPPPIAIIFAK